MLNKMTYRLRRFLLRTAIKLAGDDSIIEFPKNVKLVGPDVVPTMRLNMILGFNMSVDENQVLQICVTNMYVSSNGENGITFINKAEARTVKDTTALLALMAAKHLLASSTDGYERGITALPPGPTPNAPSQDEKTYIN